VDEINAGSGRKNPDRSTRDMTQPTPLRHCEEAHDRKRSGKPAIACDVTSPERLVRLGV